ncbi:hypothetical protein AEQ67_26240 [Pseudomonas sp. RIT-PI-q]|uniref:hypothetical protein n=1 Tax=Pseudomonas sp. RIT-PI-q TaxID=1690247 RepID=UPI0006CD5B2A|nr:hypothetical protein [Pseudomonas sp. RIT-PI-q]KPG92956.1 hypothetical protein AEQ67_26240 [Pseudomonas sp. RIT-PI-q]
MNRWRRIWLIVKLMAAVAACLTASIQAFLYMMESPDAAQIHPLSIVVVGLIFGFIVFGVLSLIDWAVRSVVPPSEPVILQPQAEVDNEAGLSPEQPLSLPADDSTQQKSAN